MVDVICDTNFLIHIATVRIKNISNLDVEIGSISFVVPKVVISELNKLSKEPSKKAKANSALAYAKKLKISDIDGQFADREILEHIKCNGGIVATLDKELKTKIKTCGGSIMSVSNDNIVLES